MDNPATIFFTIFMALWATFFIEFWKRQQARIQYDWDVADFEENEVFLSHTRTIVIVSVEQLLTCSKCCRCIKSTSLYSSILGVCSVVPLTTCNVLSLSLIVSCHQPVLCHQSPVVSCYQPPVELLMLPTTSSVMLSTICRDNSPTACRVMYPLVVM